MKSDSTGPSITACQIGKETAGIWQIPEKFIVFLRQIFSLSGFLVPRTRALIYSSVTISFTSYTARFSS